MHYMNFISPYPTPDTIFTPDQSPARLTTRQLSDPVPGQTPLVIFGGYSYSSLILKHLPPIPSIVQRFSNPLNGSAADEILLRGHKLADQSNLAWINWARDHEREKRKRRHEHKTSLTVGGEETSPEVRRSSREAKRSFDIPRSLDLGHHLRSLGHRGRRSEVSITSPEQVDVTLATPEVRYLLISPLTPPISTLAAPALGQKLWGRSSDTGLESIGKQATLAVYGDQDIFASARKIREWCDHLKAEHGPSFSSVEVAGAGHFWIEQGVEEQLRAALREWTVEKPIERVATFIADKFSEGHS